MSSNVDTLHVLTSLLLTTLGLWHSYYPKFINEQLKHRVVMNPASGHTASQRKSQDLNLGSQALDLTPLTTTQTFLILSS